MALTHIEAKSALSKASFPDPFLPVLYRLLAPYRGCGHGCVYCDGRAEKYFVEGDFAKDVAVRGNLLELLARDRDAGFCAREFGAIGLGSGVTDVYQPIERDLLLTRKSLETLSSFGEPVVLITKNDLVLRDFDLLERFLSFSWS
jgi:DNA repair photolyase